MGSTRGPDLLGRRRRSAERDFANYRQSLRPEGAAPGPLPVARGTHGRLSLHCPGAIAYSMLGGKAFRPIEILGATQERPERTVEDE